MAEEITRYDLISSLFDRDIESIIMLGMWEPLLYVLEFEAELALCSSHSPKTFLFNDFSGLQKASDFTFVKIQ